MTKRRGGAGHATDAQLMQLSVLTKLILCILSYKRDLPVRIDQEVEMTDRLQEVGFIYYRGAAHGPYSHVMGKLRGYRGQ